MAWSTPLTATTNTTLTAAQWNASVRDNLLATAPALATTAGYHFVSTGVNAIAERPILSAEVDTSQTTASTTYVDLATPGPQVTMTTGSQALVWINAEVSNSAANASYAGLNISGATTGGGGIPLAVYVDQMATIRVKSSAAALYALTAGSNTFKMVYRVGAGTGTFVNRFILVMSL